MSAQRGSRVSLVVGSEGQDGHYLTELLRGRGDRVVGIARKPVAGARAASVRTLDLRERSSVAALIDELEPAEIYYLAGVFGSSESAAADLLADFQRSSEIHAGGWLNFLDAVRERRSGARLFYASSSRVFGNPPATPQNESTPHAPNCVYGITKSAGMRLGALYRGLGVHCSSGILYNHESPRRPASFVSRKIVQAAVDIKLGAKRKLVLGNLSAAVDWGAAQDYVDAMARIVQLEQPGDFIIASGELHTVGQLAATAFAAAELPWEPHVVEDRSLIKVPPAAQALVGDNARLKQATGWRARLGFTEMVRQMVSAELQSRQKAPA
jgi:GDPmannose 4,6-dehydratase